MTWEFQRFSPDRFRPLSQKLEPIEILAVRDQDGGGRPGGGWGPKNGPEGRNFKSAKNCTGITLSGIFWRGGAKPTHIYLYRVDFWPST